MKALFVFCLVLLSSAFGLAQSSPVNPQITIGITPLVVGQPASIQVLVTNPGFSPVPTGQVSIDFGDGSDPVPMTLSTTRVETSHVYATAGKFTITATYSGDSSFAPGAASLTAVSLLSSPAYTLNTFG